MCIYERQTAVPTYAMVVSKNEISLKIHLRKSKNYFIKRNKNKPGQ